MVRYLQTLFIVLWYSVSYWLRFSDTQTHLHLLGNTMLGAMLCYAVASSWLYFRDATAGSKKDAVFNGALVYTLIFGFFNLFSLCALPHHHE
jgi:hypothetical protein